MPVDGRVRLLAVSHEASQTGAPIVLAYLLDWLKKNSDVSVRTLLVEDGPLRARFEGAGEVSALTDRSGAELLGFIERGLLARGAGRHRSARSRGSRAPVDCATSSCSPKTYTSAVAVPSPRACP